MILERKTRNTSTKAWLERVNPLQGLSITQAKSVFDVARAHGSPLLQKIYEEIELTDPVLMTCVERRQSALAGLGWRAVANASATDPEKAEAQRTALEEFANGIDNLDEAIEHLDLAFFRGFSVVQPVWDYKSKSEAEAEHSPSPSTSPIVRHINLLNSWNFLKGDDGQLMWNPNCSLDPHECDEITPSARTVQIVRRRAIDWPALIIYIRSYLGERDWGRFIERYGIPPVDAVMAPNATDKQRDEYLECAEAAKDGRVVAWPSGSTVSRAEGSRGTDPFSAFIDHQEKLTVLMATGGTLTSLAQADTGSLAGGAQMDVWEQIVKRDGVVIAGALNRQLFAPFLEMRFPGEPVMAHFEIGKEDEMSATEAADLAVKVKGAGYLVDQSQLEESVGFKLEKAPEVPPQGGLDAPFMTNKAGREGTPRTDKDETPLENAATAIENAPRKPDGQGDGPGLQALLGAFSRDLGPAADAVRELLKDIEDGKDVRDSAAALLEKLPDLLPDDPAMAAVIAEEMAKEFGDDGRARTPAAPITNKEEQPRGKTSDESTPGSFAPADGGSAATKTIKVGSTNTDTPEEQEKQIGKAQAAFEKCVSEQVDIIAAFSRPDIGDIDLRWGKRNKGLKHLIERRDGFAKTHPGELDGRATIAKMPATIIKGVVTDISLAGGHKNVILEHEGFRAIITQDHEGGNHWFISGYEISEKGRGYRASRKK